MLRASATSTFWAHNLTLLFLVCFLDIFLFVQPEQRRSLWNAKLFPVVHPFDVLEEDAGDDDILWLASTGVSDTPDQQKLSKFVEVTFVLYFVFFFFYSVVFLCCIALCLLYGVAIYEKIWSVKVRKSDFDLKSDWL